MNYNQQQPSPGEYSHTTTFLESGYEATKQTAECRWNKITRSPKKFRVWHFTLAPVLRKF